MVQGGKMDWVEAPRYYPKIWVTQLVGLGWIHCSDPAVGLGLSYTLLGLENTSFIVTATRKAGKWVRARLKREKLQGIERIRAPVVNTPYSIPERLSNAARQRTNPEHLQAINQNKGLIKV